MTAWFCSKPRPCPEMCRARLGAPTPAEYRKSSAGLWGPGARRYNGGMVEIVHASKEELAAHLTRVAGPRGVSGEFEFDFLCEGFACRASAHFDTWRSDHRGEQGGAGDAEAEVADEECGVMVKAWLAGMEGQGPECQGLSRWEAAGAGWRGVAEKLLDEALEVACRNLAATPAFTALSEARAMEKSVAPGWVRAKPSL